MNDEITDGKANWHLVGWHAKAEDGSRSSVYVRELIDGGSYEFEACTLSYRERLEIIEAIGEDRIFVAMVEISNEKQRSYHAHIHWKNDLDLLRERAGHHTSAEQT